jgi:hypothetical protein
LEEEFDLKISEFSFLSLCFSDRAQNISGTKAEKMLG